MKKILLLASLLFILQSSIFKANAQIICIFCYDQNDSISQNVNNILLNGGFENTTCAFNSNSNTFCPNSASYNCDIANWLCTGGGSGTYSCFYDSNFWYVEEGTHSAYFGNSFCPACLTGDTACLVNTDCETTGIPPGYPLNQAAYGGASGISLEQTANGLTVGATYVLEFWAGGESYGGGFPDRGLFGVDIGYGYTFLRCRPTQSYIGVGSRFLIEFNATSTSQIIKFTNWGHICNTCTELVLDDVRLYPVAELSPSVPPCAGAVVTALFTAPNHICPGTCTNFTNLSINATSFLWTFAGANPSTSTDVNPTNICYNTPGNYSVSLIATNATTSDTITLNNFITVYPSPPPQGIMQSGDTLFANAGAVSYQWYHGGNIIPGATNYFYVADTSGDFNVVATDVHGCEVEAAVFDVVASVQSLVNSSASGGSFVFPNPVGEKLEIRTLKLETAIDISIYNMLGEKIYFDSNCQLRTVDCGLLPSGIYYLEINSGEKIFRTKFVKQ